MNAELSPSGIKDFVQYDVFKNNGNDENKIA
jgi:hypothetical protein